MMVFSASNGLFDASIYITQRRNTRTMQISASKNKLDVFSYIAQSMARRIEDYDAEPDRCRLCQ